MYAFWPYSCSMASATDATSTLRSPSIRGSPGVWAMAQTPGDPLIEGLRNVEVASVADAMEQLYGQKAYMSHDMRPISKTKFAGPAYTVLLKKEEHKEGSKASQGMLDAID